MAVNVGNTDQMMNDASEAGRAALFGLQGLNSRFGNIQNAADVRRIYGIKSTGDIYAPLYKNLQASTADNMRGAFLRSGRSASPEMSFSDVLRSGENARLGLMSSEASSEQSQNSEIARLLAQAFGSADQFGLQKAGLEGNIASNLFGQNLQRADLNYRTQGPTFGDIFGTVLGAASGVAGKFAGAPRTTFNFTPPTT